MRRRHKVRYGDGEFIHWYENDDGEEIDIKVYFHTSPAEPDVNWPGGCDVTCVTEIGDDFDLWPSMSESESAQIEEAVNDYLNAQYDPDEEQ